MKNDDIEAIEEILTAAENWDLGIKGWQTLETKQDLINAIRKFMYE